MGVVDRRRHLLENIVRLRRVERELPPNRDLAAVRTALEEELGETVSLRLAARVLGVSHTALRRWADAGDLPVVIDRDGRPGVPVAALLDLRDAVEAERSSGRRRRHVLEPAMDEGRDRAERLDPTDLVQVRRDHLDGHDRAQLRGLAYHRALARRLRRPMVDDALRQIWKWRQQGAIDPRYADRWEEILSRPVTEVRRAISEDSESAAALRQTSPFAGMLSEAERRKILREIR
jgi:hypothetical protein